MYHLADFILKYPNIEFTFNMVTQPEEMSITNFYKKDLEKCSLYYEKLLPNSPSPLASLHLRKVKKAIDQSIQTTDESIDLQKFKRIHNILDDNRKQNFAVAYPEWSHLYAYRHLLPYAIRYTSSQPKQLANKMYDEQL